MIRYVDGIIEAPENGQVWRMGTRPITRQEGNDYTKTSDGFGGIELAEICWEIWRSHGFSGAPASAASFWREHMLKARREGRVTWALSASVNNLCAKGFNPLWIEAAERGAYNGTWHHYDIRSAFLWSGLTQALPTRFKPYEKGDADFILLCKGWDREELPAHFARERCLVVPEDIEVYGLTDIERHTVAGVTITARSGAFGEVLTDAIAELPIEAGKRLGQSYWGIWSQRSPVLVDTYSDGKKVRTRKMFNRLQNLPAATIITSAVVRRCWEAAREGALIVYVDSILSQRELQTGMALGDWRHEGTFPRGIVLEAPGVWTCASTAHRSQLGAWHRHAGYS